MKEPSVAQRFSSAVAHWPAAPLRVGCDSATRCLSALLWLCTPGGVPAGPSQRQGWDSEEARWWHSVYKAPMLAPVFSSLASLCLA